MSARTDLHFGEGSGRAARLQRLDDLAQLLDSRFAIPGTGIRFGLDGIVGLIPGIGDTATAVLSLYIVLQGYMLGVRKRTVLQMLVNVAVDYMIGIIPVAGDVFDFVFGCNRRNIELIRRDLEAAN
ncbi:MAG: DUF4112 domain-containing protein [Minwuia sp.]|uniref:DUF4112 domain-containing protein n=1 Tax=Minwuia sp. TaxID=2493630 RepID=UPI003A843AFD